MNIDLKLFLSTLKHQNFSVSSLRNYKTDISQFLQWKQDEDLDSSSLRSSFDIYKKYLKINYKKSSYKRKVTSISKFIEFQEPKPLSSPTYKLPTSKKYQRNAVMLGAYSLALVAALVTVPSILSNSHTTIDSAEVPNVKIESTEYKDIRAEGVKVAVSAPNEISGNPSEDTFALELISSDKFANHKQNTDSSNNEFGTGSIDGNTKTTTIYSESFSTDSFVYITPLSPTGGNVLYIESQGDGWFRVAIENETENEIEFKWAVINQDDYSKLL